MTTKESVVILNKVIAETKRAMSLTDFSDDPQSKEHYKKEIEALDYAIEQLKRFEGAVEVEKKTDPYAGVCHCWIQSVPDAGKTPKKYTLYAVPKDKK